VPPFVYPSLFWIGLPLLALPILIHLINLLRQRRVQWAAMEFLLASQRKHRKWIILKQLLLLLMRIGAIAALVLMVAQPILKDRWGQIFGGSSTHHVVLLDDSFSMTDRWADTSGFERAKLVVSRLADRATRQENSQTFTLLRFSRTGNGSNTTQPDLLNETVTADFTSRLEQIVGPLQASSTAVGPTSAIDAIEHLPAARSDETRVVYLVSDFRARDWRESSQLKKALEKLSAAGAQLYLVSTVDATRENLSLAALVPVPGVRAANVPLQMEVAVTNHGQTQAKNVTVLLEENGVARPALVIEEIPSGKTVSRRFPVVFPTAGEHLLKAQLESDPVDADNQRFAVVDVVSASPVLIIDGGPRGEDAFYLSTALAPGGKVNSGIKPVIESPRFLRDEPLEGFSAIFLANIDRLDPAEIEALENYVRQGGGVAFFAGERTTSDFYNNELYREGEGLFPLPLAQSVQLLVDRLEKVPDLVIDPHPIFAVFAGERNSFLSAVTVDRYFAAPKGWRPDPDSSVRVIAKLRNGAPLVVEKSFGEGRVVTFLTKAAPTETDLGMWNNWARGNPSFVVAMLELEGYLSAGRKSRPAKMVGSPLEVAFDTGAYLPQVQFQLPASAAGAGSAAASLTVDAVPVEGKQMVKLNDTQVAGFYIAELTAADGTVEKRYFAINVDPAEGKLARVESQDVSNQLAGVNFQWHAADGFAADTRQLAGFNLGQSLLYILLIVLLCEQVLAYFTSYHRPERQGARA
jgi:hypothetical protein